MQPRTLLTLLTALSITMIATGAALAETKLKWAHVYEITEPYHKNALWAADEIKKRTNGKYSIDVFPASQLGNEPSINEGLSLGTIDIIYTGVAFAGSVYKPFSMLSAPFMFRDFEHWIAFRDSPLFTELANGYAKVTGNHAPSLTYYGQRHVTSNKPITKPEDMKGMKLRIPQAPVFIMFAKSVGANATPIAFSEVYLALQQGVVDGQENPIPTIIAKKFYEVQKYINLTGHITESLLMIVGGPTWKKLTPDEQKIFAEVMIAAAKRNTDEIRAQEQSMVAQFAAFGNAVTQPDREAFRQAAVPLLTGPDAAWPKELYERLQAIK